MSDPGIQADGVRLLRSFSGFDAPVRFSGAGAQRQIIAHPNGQQLILSTAAFHLLKAIRNGDTVDQIYERQLEAGAGLDRCSVERACEKAFEEFKRLARDKVSDELPWGFWTRFVLVPEFAVSRGAGWCEPMFSLPVMATCFAICSVGAFGAHCFLHSHQAGATNIFTLYLLFLFSLVCHEFGHASACTHFKCRAKEIGFTIYLIYPAFYCDVTAAWALGKWRRVVVDLSGCYFQATIGGLFSILWLITHYKIFGTASVAIFYSICFSLSPIFRTDGYWVFADILGVNRLDRGVLPAIRGLLSKIRGIRRPDEKSAKIELILMAYSLVTSVVWLKFSLHILPYLLSSSKALLSQLLLITSSLSATHRASLQTAMAFLSSAFIVSLAYFGAARFAISLIGKLRILIGSAALKLRSDKHSGHAARERV